MTMSRPQSGFAALAHRRPNLATAPTISSSATPMTPAPAMPQTVEVATVTRNWLEAVLAARGGADRRPVIAGERLVARRDQRLHLGILAGHHPVDGLRLELDLPAASARVADSAMLSAGALPVLVTTIGIELCCAARARAEQPVAARRPELRLADDVERKLGLGGGVLGVDRHRHREMPGVDRGRRPHLQLDVLRLAGLDRDRGQFLAAIGFGERGLEIRRRFGGEADLGCGRCRS